MQSLTMTINGQMVPGQTTFAVLNPATEQVLADAPAASLAQLDSAVEAAERAFARWRIDAHARRRALRDCAQALRPHAADLARLLTTEQGKPLDRARSEIDLSIAWFELTAELPIPHQVLQDTERARIELLHHPLGVVGAITPWNYPIILAICKVAPALLAGNTVVLKPSPFTPLTTLRIGELLRNTLPPGVFNVVSGSDELGAALSRHSGVRKISFTGSVETGKKVAAAAAADLKRLTLELGGNDPAVVLADVAVDRVAEPLFWAALENNGQFCSAIKRVYVHTSLHRPLVDALCEIARSARVGNGLDPQTQLGPLNNRMQYERVCRLVEQARAAGATVLTGGAPLPGPGYFYPPTLLTDTDDTLPVVIEEQFGPVLPILVYDDIEELVERVNRTHYGLGASVWSSNIAAAAELAVRIEAGTTWINQHGALSNDAPFGGAKWSGVGVEYGVWGLLEFTQAQVINISKT
ncbi:MAG: aldehyde dehydrogenase family protein [Roseiflexaceae bacterium]